MGLRPSDFGRLGSACTGGEKESIYERTKNLERRKRARRAIFRTVEVRVKGALPHQPLLCLQHSRWVTVQPVRGNLIPKMNITLFIRNEKLNIFLFNNFFEKSSILRENSEKLFGGAHLTIF